jgi:two-component system sensor histidine kinase KdpD
MASSVGRARVRAGIALGVVVPPVLVPPLAAARGTLNLASDVSVYLVLVVGITLLGGLGPALLTAAMAGTLLTYYFVPPIHTFSVNDPDNVVALLSFGAVALMVSWIVDVAARRAAEAADAARIEAADRMRTALLAAVGHDLRTPLATAKAVVSGLRTPPGALTDDDRAELLETGDHALDRLTALVDDLLDLSRLQAGVLPLHLRPTDLSEVVVSALDDLGVEPRGVVLDLADDLPAVQADAGLLERVVVNLVANAQRHAAQPPLVTGAQMGRRVELCVVDHGPGIPLADRERVFAPFQRLGDTDTSTGVGLGLALARGLTEAMGGTLTPHETPGGGLTMRVSLPVAPEPGAAA